MIILKYMDSGYITGSSGSEEKLVNEVRLDKPGRITITKPQTGLKSIDIIHLIEALEGIKLDFDHLYYYEHTGLLVPSLVKSQGRGVPKLYSTEDFIVLRWLISLQKKGIPVKRFRDILDFIKEKMPDVLKTPQNWNLVTDGKSIRFVNKVTSRTFEVSKDTEQYLFSFPKD
jgi:DNA-binding transcriptional MerR regulator